MHVELYSKTSSYGYLDVKAPVKSVTEVPTPPLISVESQNAEPSVSLPAWQERPSASIGVTIAEVDNLSVDSTDHAEPLEEPSSSSRADGSTPLPPKTVSEKTNMILDILERYRMNTAKGAHREWAGRSKVFHQVKQHLESQTAIRMILPAFPFKSPNKGGKILGDLPDAAEEVAMKHLHGLCVMIEEIHGPGAQLNIVSDGLMYNGMFRPSCPSEEWINDFLHRSSRDPRSGSLEVWTSASAACCRS
jgi:Pyoverdine/dityrosine biosynthesis protein